jgi:hypothetical protein
VAQALCAAYRNAMSGSSGGALNASDAASCNYWFGMARRVWIASPVSHANPMVTAAR